MLKTRILTHYIAWECHQKVDIIYFFRILYLLCNLSLQKKIKNAIKFVSEDMLIFRQRIQVQKGRKIVNLTYTAYAA